jgi:glutamine amidotransferase
MGWSRLERPRLHGLTEGIDEEARFYFAHSFAVIPDDERDVIGVSAHGSRFVSAVARENVLGIQFHAEKSHRYGKALLGNFLRGF